MTGLPDYEDALRQALTGIEAITDTEKVRAADSAGRVLAAPIVADRDLPKGHLITEADIWARRPGSGEIAAYDFDKVVGKRLKRALTRNTQLKWGDLG